MPNQNPNPSILALDFGAKRIGIAIASLVARLPEPLDTLVSSPTLFDDIEVLVKAHNAKAVVVGLPRSLEGNETAQTTDARHFSQELAGRLNIEVYLQDEAVTSKQAEAELADRRVRYNREHVDSLAATYILEDFLRAHPEVK